MSEEIKGKVLKLVSKGSTLALIGLVAGPFLMGLSSDIGVEAVDGLGAGIFMASLFGGIFMLVKATIDDM